MYFIYMVNFVDLEITQGLLTLPSQIPMLLQYKLIMKFVVNISCQAAAINLNSDNFLDVARRMSIGIQVSLAEMFCD